MNASLTVRTASPQQTRALGREVGRRLLPGAVVGLEGELGVGKTCFVKGLATGLGLDGDEIASPTFTLIAEHYRQETALFHIDLYRLEGRGAEDMEELGLEEYLFGRGVSAVEWFRFLPADLLEEYLLVSLRCGPAEVRMVTLTAYGEPYQRLMAGLVKHTVFPAENRPHAYCSEIRRHLGRIA